MLEITRNYLLQVFLGNKKSSDCKQTCDTYNAYDSADRVGMVDDNVSGNSKYENLKDVRGSKVNKHAYKLKADYDSEYVVQEMCRVVKITVDGEDMIYLLEDHVSHCAESDYGNDDFHDLDYDM
jgi:hypothetical protein